MTMLYRRVDEAELDEVERDPDLARLLMEDTDDDDPRLLDLGTAWHGVHMLLNGSAWGGSGAAFDAVLGGDAVGEPSTYEPVRFLDVPRVAAVAEHLSGREVEQLRRGFTPATWARAEVYPDGWSEPDVLMTLVAPAYARLRAFLSAAADAGDGVLITLRR